MEQGSFFTGVCVWVISSSRNRTETRIVDKLLTIMPFHGRYSSPALNISSCEKVIGSGGKNPMNFEVKGEDNLNGWQK